MIGIWGKLERGECTAAEFKEIFEDLASQKFGRHLPEEIVTRICDGRVPINPFPEMVDTIRCLRAEGIKTAVLTNNWFVSKNKSFLPVDQSLFNVVRTIPSSKGFPGSQSSISGKRSRLVFYQNIIRLF